MLEPIEVQKGEKSLKTLIFAQYMVIYRLNLLLLHMD